MIPRPTICALLLALGPCLVVAQEEVAPAPIVFACVDKKGELLSAVIALSSGYTELDEAALKVARATKFTPAKNPASGKPKRKSCLKFKVKFVIRDGKPVPEQA